MKQEEWFSNCGGFAPKHDLGVLRTGIEDGLIYLQDEYGMTALALAVMSRWREGVVELLHAGADTEQRYFRTGETALGMAVQEKDEAIVSALLAAGANPDAANYWGVTPRTQNPSLFAHIPPREIDWPAPRIQNAEHLADHHHPRFHIPSRKERESLRPGQAVSLYVYGPKGETKQDTVKVRIIARSSGRSGIRYTADVEAPLENTHLAAGTKVVEFGPEHVATVYVPRGQRDKRVE